MVHAIEALYGELYRFGTRVPKRDRYGIHKTIEDECLSMLRIAIGAALERKETKAPMVRTLSVQNEVLKHLVRTAHESGSVSLPSYVQLQKRLQEISRMTAGWLKYLERREPHR